MSEKITSSDIEKSLIERHKNREPWRQADWALLRELRSGTGYADNKNFIDYWAIHCYPSHGFVRIAYEIKVKRRDFRREIKNPQKRQFGLDMSNLFYFVAPAGMLDVEEIPEECGLMEVSRDQLGHLHNRIVKKAPHREPSGTPGWSFIASLCRRLNKQESIKSTRE